MIVYNYNHLQIEMPLGVWSGLMKLQLFTIIVGCSLLIGCKDTAKDSTSKSDDAKTQSITIDKENNSGLTIIDPNKKKIIDINAVNGKEVSKDKYPALVKIQDTDEQHCTGALVSWNTVITAAHCIDNHKTTPATPNEIFFILRDKIYPFECTMISHYGNAPYVEGRLRDTRDVALCKATRDLPGSILQDPITNATVTPFFSVDLNSNRTVGDIIKVGGYGCREKVSKPSSENDYVWDWKLRLGNTEISKILTDTIDGEGKPFGYFTSVSWADDEKADICPGDSGGPVFSLSAAQDDAETIVAVNSGYSRAATQRRVGDIVDRRTSQYTDLRNEDVSQFIKTWLDENEGQFICGVNISGKEYGCK